MVRRDADPEIGDARDVRRIEIKFEIPLVWKPHFVSHMSCRPAKTGALIHSNLDRNFRARFECRVAFTCENEPVLIASFQTELREMDR